MHIKTPAIESFLRKVAGLQKENPSEVYFSEIFQNAAKELFFIL